MLHEIQLFCIDLILTDNHTSHALHNIMISFMHAHSKHFSIMHNLIHLLPNLDAFWQIFSMPILMYANNSLAISCMHASPTLAPTLNSCNQELSFHVMHKPHHIPKAQSLNNPNVDDVMLIIIIAHNAYALLEVVMLRFNSKILAHTKDGVSSNCFKEWGEYDNAQYDADPKVKAKAAHPRVKMKKLFFLYTIHVPFDPG